jgi:hypothetical protein
MTPVRGIGIGDIAAVEKISIKKILFVLTDSRHLIQPKQQYYDCLEMDVMSAGKEGSMAGLCLS